MARGVTQLGNGLRVLIAAGIVLSPSSFSWDASGHVFLDRSLAMAAMADPDDPDPTDDGTTTDGAQKPGKDRPTPAVETPVTPGAEKPGKDRPTPEKPTPEKPEPSRNDPQKIFTSSRDIDPTYETVLTDLETRSIIRNFDAMREECGSYDPIYRIDCLKQNIELTLERMPKGPDFTEMRQALTVAAAKLDAIVKKHEDLKAPKQKADTSRNSRFKKRRTYRAIKAEEAPVALKEAEAVIAEAETTLLRSSENSEKRLAHYQDVAIAVGSTKVLLRS